jgi:hypothetical protein
MELLKKRYLCDCGRWFFDIEGPVMCAKNKHEAGNHVEEPHPISKNKTPHQSNSRIALTASSMVVELVSRRAAETRPRKR